MGIEPGLRYYVTGTVLDGLWLDSHLEFSGQILETSSDGLSAMMTSNEDRFYRMGVAALVGYSTVVSRGLTIQAGVGLGAEHGWGWNTVNGITLPEGTEQTSKFDIRTWAISERVTLAVGWAF
jgi:hypothetical protein